MSGGIMGTYATAIIMEAHLEAGRSQLLCMLVKDLEEILILDARHLQNLSRAVADVARIQ